MTFAQALARIEEINGDMKLYIGCFPELKDLLIDHADSIVQLGKVAGEMRDAMDGTVFECAEAYDKLMNGEEG